MAGRANSGGGHQNRVKVAKIKGTVKKVAIRRGTNKKFTPDF